MYLLIWSPLVFSSGMESTRHYSRRNPERKRRPTRITIPKGVSPHVRLVFSEMKRQTITYDMMEERSSILRSTIKAWRHRNVPSLTSIEAVLGALGFDFMPIPREKILPVALVADLASIAERHGLSMPDTVEAFVSILAQGRKRLPEAPSTAPALDEMAPIGGTDSVAA